MDSYYILRQLFYYKVQHSLFQIATGVTKCDEFITNCDRYCKVRWLLQIATELPLSLNIKIILLDLSVEWTRIGTLLLSEY